MRRILLALALPLWLAACGGPEPIWAPDDVVARSAVSVEGPKYVSLVTVVSKGGSGAHSGLIVNASQRVIFDPAGTFKHPAMPERNDVIYGATDQRIEVYYDYHARVTYDVLVDTIEVSPAVAELILNKVQAYGAVAKARCAESVSSILTSVPGFESLPHTWFPTRLEAAFAKLPGVRHRRIKDTDADDNRHVIYKYIDGKPPEE